MITYMLLSVAILTSLLPSSHGICGVVLRSSWGARAPKSTTRLSTPVPMVVIHHTEGTSCSSYSSCIGTVRGIQNYHMNTRGWSDIGYNFLIGGDGTIFEGRGFTKVGAHAKGYNSQSIGISLIGNFQSARPTSAQLNAARNLISCAVSNGYVRSSYNLKGHRNVGSTDCPGNTLYNIIRNWPRFSP